MTGMVIAVALLTVITACTSGKAASSSSVSASVPDTPSATVSVPPTSAAPSTPPITSSTAAPSTPASTTAAPTSSTPAPSSPTSTVPSSACSKISVMVLPGGAVPNTQIAGLVFTNSGSTACTLTGYPAVQLIAGGRDIGRPSRPASTAPSSIRLRPGQQAESRLTDDVRNCTGQISDHARVAVPGLGTTSVQPIELRACTLRVEPLGPPD